MKRSDIHTILVPGSGAIVIGQAGSLITQARKRSRRSREGYRVVLVNSNPATIMTDPELQMQLISNRSPLNPWKQSLRRKNPMPCFRPSAGKRELNLALALSENGVLEKYGVQLIGANLSAIKAAEDRMLFRETMQKAGIPVPQGGAAYSLKEAEALIKETGYPILVRASFAMGGSGASWVNEPAELPEAIRKAISELPIHQAWLKSPYSAGRNMNSRSCAIKPITLSLCVPSKTLTRWVCIQATALPLLPRKRLRYANFKSCAISLIAS